MHHVGRLQRARSPQFGETLRWNTVLAYLFVVVAVVFAVWDKL